MDPLKTVDTGTYQDIEDTRRTEDVNFEDRNYKELTSLVRESISRNSNFLPIQMYSTLLTSICLTVGMLVLTVSFGRQKDIIGAFLGSVVCLSSLALTINYIVNGCIYRSHQRIMLARVTELEETMSNQHV